MRSTTVVVLLAVCGASSIARGQASTLTPFPLELKRKPANTTKAELDELQKQYVRLVLKSGVLAPETVGLEVAMKELKRQDCDREDECLKQLALKAQTLYALYASLDYTLEGVVVASGRVVRDDGKVASPLQTVSIPRGKDPFKDVARVALARLIDQLGLATLPPVRPVEVAVKDPVKVDPQVKKDPEVTADAGISLPPPPPPPLEPSPLKSVGTVTLVAGGGLALVGGIVLGVGASEGSKLTVVDGAVRRDQVDQAVTSNTLQGIGSALLIAGGVGAAAGLVMRLVAPDEAAPTVSVAPMPGGAAVMIGGAL